MRFVDITASETLTRDLNDAMKRARRLYQELSDRDPSDPGFANRLTAFNYTCQFIQTCERFSALRYGQTCEMERAEAAKSNTNTKEKSNAS